MVDSYGSLYPIQIREITDMYLKAMAESGKLVGIHAHNNQQCAFANTVQSLAVGASMLDGTVMGMGRGAGNSLAGRSAWFPENPKYGIAPVLSFIEKHMLKLLRMVQYGAIISSIC